MKKKTTNHFLFASVWGFFLVFCCCCRTTATDASNALAMGVRLYQREELGRSDKNPPAQALNVLDKHKETMQWPWIRSEADVLTLIIWGKRSITVRQRSVSDDFVRKELCMFCCLSHRTAMTQCKKHPIFYGKWKFALPTKHLLKPWPNQYEYQATGATFNKTKIGIYYKNVWREKHMQSRATKNVSKRWLGGTNDSCCLTERCLTLARNATLQLQQTDLFVCCFVSDCLGFLVQTLRKMADNNNHNNKQTDRLAVRPLNIGPRGYSAACMSNANDRNTTLTLDKKKTNDSYILLVGFAQFKKKITPQKRCKIITCNARRSWN